METSDGIHGSLRPSGQKSNIFQRRSIDGQQQDPSDKHWMTLTDLTSGLLKDPADGEGCFTTRPEDTNASPQSAPRPHEVDVDSCPTNDELISPTRNPTVDVTYGSKTSTRMRGRCASVLGKDISTGSRKVKQIFKEIASKSNK